MPRFPFVNTSHVTASGPALASYPITPAAADLPTAIRAVTLNGAGTLSWVSWDGTECSTGPLPVGTYPLCARRINAAGTTATGLTGWV